MTKVALLHALAGRAATAFDVAATFGMAYPTAGMALLRAVRQGLVDRAFDPWEGCYHYRLSPKGAARLQYWLDGQRDDPEHPGPEGPRDDAADPDG